MIEVPREEYETLKAVAVAAKALVRTATGDALFRSQETVDEKALTELETALAAAGYDMTDEEFLEIPKFLRSGND
jgi:hypothetical protein